MGVSCHCAKVGESLCPLHRKMVTKRPKTTFQRMTLAAQLAGEIKKHSVNPLITDMAWAIDIVLSAPSEYLATTYARIDALLEKSDSIVKERKALNDKKSETEN